MELWSQSSHLARFKLNPTVPAPRPLAAVIRTSPSSFPLEHSTTASTTTKVYEPSLDLYLYPLPLLSQELSISTYQFHAPRANQRNVAASHTRQWGTASRHCRSQELQHTDTAVLQRPAPIGALGRASLELHLLNQQRPAASSNVTSRARTSYRYTPAAVCGAVLSTPMSIRGDVVEQRLRIITSDQHRRLG